MKKWDYDLKVAQVIKNYRRAKQIKQFTIATALEMTVSNYSKMERGIRPITSGQLEIIGRTIGVPHALFLLVADCYNQGISATIFRDELLAAIQPFLKSSA